MKDRAPSIGERAYSQTGDFSGILKRFEEREYKKILVRGLHAPDFWYDNSLWAKSSGIRQVLLNNYREIRTIAGVTPPVSTRDQVEDPYLFGAISVLVPRERRQSGDAGGLSQISQVKQYNLEGSL
jgi:hypothetical protein